MTRRVAVALAAAMALTAGALTYAVGATFGLFGSNAPGHTGQLSPVADVPGQPGRTPRVETVYVDVTAPPVKPAPRPAATRPAEPQRTVVVYDAPSGSTVSTAPVTEHETETETHTEADD